MTRTENRLAGLAAAALARSPGRPVLEYSGHWFTWGEFADLAGRIETAMSDSGVQPRARVAFVARNRPAAIGAFVALIARAYSIHMIYPFQSGAAMAREILKAEPEVVLAEQSDFGDEVCLALRELGAAAIALGEQSVERVAGLEGVGHRRDVPEQAFIQILTSGTTGKPKPFYLSYETIHRDLVAPQLRPDVDLDKQPPTLLYFPVGNISGVYSSLPPLLSGLRAVLLDRFSLEGWLDYLKRYQPPISGLPPAAFQMVLDADIPREDLSCLRMLGAGAAPLPVDVQTAFEERYGIPILLSYGATEFAGPVTRMTPELLAEFGASKRGSVGRAIPGAHLRVIDPESGAELPAGEQGVLEVISPRIGPEWIRTADLAVIDEDGFIYIRGRADGAIIRGGFKILPETIEEALLKHPAVSAAAVVGVEDSRLGQVPAAAVRLKPGAGTVDREALEQHLRQHLLATHIPVHWRFVDELPRTELSFKIKQQAVRALFSE